MLDMETGNDGAAAYPIIVHSHLQWDWVWQRPQQFLSRLSKKHRVLFIEGPQLEKNLSAPRYTLQASADFPNITIMRTFFPKSRFSDGEWVDAQRLKLVREALGTELQGDFTRPVQWFYDPMCAPIFIGKLGERAVVYDCMDQLSQFKFAPPQLIEREKMLLLRADLVFAGGRKMWEDKRRSNANSHFYGCGVDVEHFGHARAQSTAVPADIADLPAPVFGYFGVVDERLDYELLARLADENPSGSVVMVGPLCKVEEKDLPQRPNLHWMGGRSYLELPAYSKAFAVCLMPFVMNEATEFINPTKALEYMATGTPIVSTPIPDVVSNFGTVVKIGRSHDEFLQLCRAAVAQPDQEAIERGVKMAHENTWDAIVSRIDEHIQDALRVLAEAEEATRAPVAVTKLRPAVLSSAERTSSVSV